VSARRSEKMNPRNRGGMPDARQQAGQETTLLDSSASAIEAGRLGGGVDTIDAHEDAATDMSSDYALRTHGHSFRQPNLNPTLG